MKAIHKKERPGPAETGCGAEGVVADAAQEGIADQSYEYRGKVDELKPWRTCQAACALAGFRADLLEGDDGRPMLVVSRWALTRCFSSVAEATSWVSQVTGAPA